MKPAEIISQLCDMYPRTTGKVLRHLADSVVDAQLPSGARVLDASDFKLWLTELANEADKELA